MTNTKLLKKIMLVASVIFLFPLMVHGQEESAAVKKRKKQLDKQESVKRKESEKAKEERLKRHMDIQTKDVRKRMKKNKRKSKRINDNKRKFFILRWFD